MISAQELLIYRLNVVESSFISGKRAGNIAAVSETFKEKMKHVNTKLASLEKEIPAVGECTEMLQQLEPILLHKRIGLLQMAEKVEELLEKKSQLVVAIDDLMNIKELVGVINTDSFKDMDMLQEQVEKVERLLVPIVSETKRQTAEIDNLLDTYEQAMLVFSEVCQKWEQQLEEA